MSLLKELVESHNRLGAINIPPLTGLKHVVGLSRLPLKCAHIQ
jgi:hypothetical protein